MCLTKPRVTYNGENETLNVLLPASSEMLIQWKICLSLSCKERKALCLDVFQVPEESVML